MFGAGDTSVKKIYKVLSSWSYNSMMGNAHYARYRSKIKIQQAGRRQVLSRERDVKCLGWGGGES